MKPAVTHSVCTACHLITHNVRTACHLITHSVRTGSALHASTHSVHVHCALHASTHSVRTACQLPQRNQFSAVTYWDSKLNCILRWSLRIVFSEFVPFRENACNLLTASRQCSQYLVNCCSKVELTWTVFERKILTLVTIAWQYLRPIPSANYWNRKWK